MRSILPLLLLLLAGFTAPAPSGAPFIALDEDVETRWVPFELTAGNQIRFALDIDGHPASAILDTGVSHSVVSPEFARRAGLTIGTRGRASAIGGDVAIGWTASSRLRFGGLTRQGGRLAVAPLPALATGDAAPVDALIGGDILSCCALDIDYDGGRFRLLRSGRMPFIGHRVPLSLAPGSHVYVSEVALGGQRIQPVLVDTGDGSALTMVRAAWSRARLGALPVTSTIAFGLGGAVTTGLAVAPGLMLGDVTAADVEVRIEDSGGFTGRVGMQGRIGSGLLQRYRVLLDPRAGQMVLLPGRLADRPPVRSTSGLLVGREPGRLRVLHVMRGSPAAQGGWQAGDTICAVDDQPVAGDRQVAAAMTLLIGAPGQTVDFSLCDGARRTLQLARFY